MHRNAQKIKKAKNVVSHFFRKSKASKEEQLNLIQSEDVANNNYDILDDASYIHLSQHVTSPAGWVSRGYVRASTNGKILSRKSCKFTKLMQPYSRRTTMSRYVIY